MRAMTSTKLMTGKFIKATPNGFRRIADAMENELREGGECAIEVANGVVFFFEKDGSYAEEFKSADPHPGSN